MQGFFLAGAGFVVQVFFSFVQVLLEYLPVDRLLWASVRASRCEVYAQLCEQFPMEEPVWSDAGLHVGVCGFVLCLCLLLQLRCYSYHVL